MKKKFCINGHNIETVGRFKNRACKMCSVKRYGDNKERSRAINRKSNWKLYGMVTIDGVQFTNLDYDRLYQIQQGKCAVCKIHAAKLTRRLSVDHDHETGVVRGLLCVCCNTKLGIYEDNVFRKLVKKYLKSAIGSMEIPKDAKDIPEDKRNCCES